MADDVVVIYEQNTLISQEVETVVIESAGPQGPPGPPGGSGSGVGIPVGGTTGQVLAKASATDGDTAWVDQTGGTGGGGSTAWADITGKPTTFEPAAHTHGEATTSAAGFMAAADKTKLDGIAAGAQVNVATNLAQGTRTTTTVPVTSSTGTSATLDAATGLLAGVMSATDKAKLDGVAANANNYTLPAATSTVLGGIKLASDTVQTTAANAATATASRTYGVQVNAAGQGVVNVPWVDTDTVYTPPANHPASIITQDASNRFVTDAEKTAWNAKEAGGAVAAHAAAGDPHPQYTTAAEASAAAPVQSVAGKSGIVTLVKGDVGLGSVDNTADTAKPVSTAQQTAFDGKEPTITTGTTSQFWRGDKTWRDFATDVRAAVLTGLSTATATVATAADTVLVAIGKLQAQIALKLDAANPSYTGTLTGGTGAINIGSGQIVKDASGNVGFGGTPSQKMHVYGTLRLESSGGVSVLQATETGVASRTLRIEASQTLHTVGIFGYGAGAGILVNQPASDGFGGTGKGSRVTANKPSAKITLQDTSMAPGQRIVFRLNNSLLTTGRETINTSMAWGAYDPGNYRIDGAGMGVGACQIAVTNVSASTLAEPITIQVNFSIGAES